MGHTAKFTNAIRSAWTMIGGAREAGSAVELRRAPSAESLRKLGIDAEHASRLSF